MSFFQTLRFAACIAQVVPIPRWNVAKVKRLQRKRLQRLVGMAIARSPFYREKYRGIDPNRCALSDLPPCGFESEPAGLAAGSAFGHDR